MGRLTRDPEVRYSQAAEPLAIARYTLAVDRRFHKDNEQSADFINCVAFGRSGEFAEKYFHKGTKIVVTGRIQTGSYTNKEGQTVYTTEVAVEDQEFAETKASQGNSGFSAINALIEEENNVSGGSGGFMNIPDGVDEELPFT